TYPLEDRICPKCGYNIEDYEYLDPKIRKILDLEKEKRLRREREENPEAAKLYEQEQEKKREEEERRKEEEKENEESTAFIEDENGITHLMLTPGLMFLITFVLIAVVIILNILY
ncbi:MAG: hypothetical protein PUH29_10350, partial [Lachnospiraceae bacterium]|nr:hypothetical protein [Lachnospiraceae bacterium]